MGRQAPRVFWVFWDEDTPLLGSQGCCCPLLVKCSVPCGKTPGEGLGDWAWLVLLS